MIKYLRQFNIVSFDSLRSYSATMSHGKLLNDVVDELERFAPKTLAEKWDNVGLLIQPYKERSISKIMLTNDLTERVMQEAVKKNVGMIISYHPPIFTPLKRITQSHWKERIVSICLAESIAVYSPHTAWDSVIGGVNDWLASAVPVQFKKSIQPNLNFNDGSGAGRIISSDVNLREAVAGVQKLIGLDVHLAIGRDHSLDTHIKRVAVCAGSGGSVLKEVKADLYITGEMSHHDLLEANHQNTSVILCNHSNSERGFLRHFQTQLTEILDEKCEVFVADADEDPLKTIVKN